MEEAIKKEEPIILYRYRFMEVGDDYRPVEWPIPWPYWCSGYGTNAEEANVNILVVYAPDEDYIKKYWPGCYDIDKLDEGRPPEEILFTGRFPKPSWYTGPYKDKPEQGAI